MGCSNSAHDRRVEPAPKQQRVDGLYFYVGPSSTELAFKFITESTTNFYCSCGMVPSVCLHEQSFPIITAKLSNQDDQNDIPLPVFSGSFFGTGRVICFPHIGILDELSDRSSTGKIFVHALSWLAHQKSTMTPILLLGFPQDLVDMSTSALHNFGFFVESTSRASKLTSYKVVLIASTFDTFDDGNCKRLMQYVSEGGGLAVFFSPADAQNPLSFPINPLLSKFGLSYTFCSISESDQSFEVNSNYDDVKIQHFDYHIQTIKNLLAGDPSSIPQNALDFVVTELRYHAVVCGEGQRDKLKELSQICWDYLFKTDVIKNNMFCHTENHCMILVLIQDILPKIPAEYFSAIQGHEIFPGKCEETEMSDITITLTIQDESWVSTGLYLPAGCTGYVECDQVFSDEVHLQIGAHHESLMQRPSPWKRWPLIILPFAMSEKRTALGSPFGGPVYVAASDDLEGSLTLTLTFKGFVRYPRWVRSDPTVWEETKDKKVPLGEMECDHVIFTMPSDLMKELDFNAIDKAMESITSSISSFMSYPLEKPFRAVFDIELLEDAPVCGYPIVFKIDEAIPMLGNIDKPSLRLFSLANLMAIVTIREGCFDSTIETAIASIASSIAFSNLYENFDPLSFPELPLPPLFKELWEIYNTFDKFIIPKTLMKFQDPSYELIGVPEDTWIDFVREMCRIGETDFTKILERSRPIPLNVSMSCHGFPVFDPDAPFEQGDDSALISAG